MSAGDGLQRWSGFNDQEAASARRVVLHGCELLLAAPGRVHYTQGPLRWEGIDRNLRVLQGECITHGDCSSTATWLLWNALRHVSPGMPDIVNGERWRAGFTGTLARHGKIVHHLGNAKVGDLVLYGPAPTYEHVAVYVGGGKVMSHGSEGGPFKLGVDYRGDRGVIRRYI